MVNLPTLQYIVFYNGKEAQPDEMELRLSDAFMQIKKQKPALECRVRMLNINLGHNQQLMRDCQRLWEYAVFVGEVNENLGNGYRMEAAVNKAIDSCIQEGILEDVLVRSRSEVLHMLLTEYDAKRHLKNTYEEGKKVGREEGVKSGRAEGLQQGQQQIISLNKKLVEAGRLKDLIRASKDDAYREKLLQEYGLSGGRKWP